MHTHYIHTYKMCIYTLRYDIYSYIHTYIHTYIHYKVEDLAKLSLKRPIRVKTAALEGRPYHIHTHIHTHAHIHT